MIFFQKVGQLLVENQKELSLNINKHLSESYISRLNQSGLENESIATWRAQLIALIGEAILLKNQEAIEAQAEEWATQTAAGAVRHGVNIDQLMVTVRLYREVIWQHIEENIDINSMMPSSILRTNQIIDAILDHVAYIFGISYVTYSTKTLKAAQQAFNEVSFPVVAVSKAMAILPLIGELAEERASNLLEKVVTRAAALRIEELIVDLSGVPMIDTLAANQLFHLNQTLNLIGVRCTFTGIRPELALPLVELRVEFEQLNVKGSLKDALASMY